MSNQIAITLVLAMAVTGPAALAQLPLVYQRGALNAASFMPQSLSGGSIARGSMFSIFGAHFGPSAPAQASSFPLQIALSNVSVTITQGDTTVNAIPVYVSGGQVNAIMPSNAPLGTAMLRVVNGNVRSNVLPVQIADTAFGIFTATGSGVGPGILQNFVAADNQPINAPAVTAKPGQTIILWGTGLGAVPYGDTIAPSAGSLPTKVEVSVGGKNAVVAYSGRTPCCTGIDQVVFTVPDDAPPGCWVPVYVRTGGLTVSNVVTMAVQTDGSTCTDAQNPVSPALVKGLKVGGFVAVRAVTRQDIGTMDPVEVSADYHGSAAFAIAASPFPFNGSVSLPPPGSCTAYAVAGDLLGGTSVLTATPTSKLLDFGPMLTLTGPRGMKMLSSLIAGTNAGYLGGAVGGNLVRNSLFLDPGSYSLLSPGGRDIGSFTTSFTVPQPLTWTNRDQLRAVPRAQPLNLAWSGGPPDQLVGVLGVSEDLPTNASAAFACVASPGANSFTVPAAMMANLPATRSNVLQSKSVIYLVTLTRSMAGRPSASGLDSAVAISAYISGKTVVFQ